MRVQPILGYCVSSLKYWSLFGWHKLMKTHVGHNIVGTSLSQVKDSLGRSPVNDSVART